MATVQDQEVKDNVEASDSQVPTQRSMGRRRSDYIDVDNPLRGVDLDAAVKRFVAATKLTDLTEIILRGAYLAEDPDNYPNVEGLTASDLNALKREYEETRPLRILVRVPKQLRTIIITCSVAAITQFVYTFHFALRCLSSYIADYLQRMGPGFHERSESVLAARTRIEHGANPRCLAVRHHQRLLLSLCRIGVSVSLISAANLTQLTPLQWSLA